MSKNSRFLSALCISSFLAETYSSVCTPYSTIGAHGLNFRVRHGAGCDTVAISTKKLFLLPHITSQFLQKQLKEGEKSLDVLVPVSSTPLNAYTSGLSIRSSSGHLTSISGIRYLILKSASHLDAFSGYPFRTLLPGLCGWRHNRYTSGSSIPVLSY